MIIAFDYDGTLKGSSCHLQQECWMWADIMRTFRSEGHGVIIATMRTGSEADRADVGRWLEMAGLQDVPVIYCGERGLKDEVCRAEGYKVGIWVDDMPDSIRQPVPMLMVGSGE